MRQRIGVFTNGNFNVTRTKFLVGFKIGFGNQCDFVLNTIRRNNEPSTSALANNVQFFGSFFADFAGALDRINDIFW